MVTTRDHVRTPRARRIAALAAALCLAALAAPPLARAAAGSFEASVTPTVVDDGDTVRLTLRFRGDAPAARPNLSPLQRDFELLGSQQSQRVSIVDGAVDAIHELEILLSPKHAGDIEIPALHAGDLATEPLHLTVRDGGTGRATTAPSAATGSSRTPSSADVAARVARSGEMPGLFVDAQVDQANPFVQGEVRYTVRVYDALGIREGALTEPTAEGVRIEARGDTRTYEDVVGGRRYVVHEREFAAFPQNGGEVVIPPVVLQARVADPDARARRSPFDDMFDGDDAFAEMFARMRRSGFGGSILDRVMDPGREVRVRSNPVTLSVRGRPADAGDGWFLPATAVTLTQSWSPERPGFRVGETVTRTVTLHATGASAAQLPAIAPGDLDGVKQYAAKPETRDVADGAELVQRIDVLPTAAGTLTLPRVEIPWWDTATDTRRTAVLPEETIQVLPAGGAPQQAAIAPAPAAAQHASGQAPSALAQDVTAAPQPASAARHAGGAVAASDGIRALPALVASHPVASAVTLLLLALAAAAAWLLPRRHASGSPMQSTMPRGGVTANGATRPGVARATTSATPARALVDAVHQACAASDARATRTAVVAWGRALRHDARLVDALAVARLTGDDAFVRAVKALDDSLFAPQAASFDGAAFRRAFDAARRSGGRDAKAAPMVLPALYPDSRPA